MYVALRKSIHFREIFEWAFTDGVTTSVNMWLCCRQALVFWLNNFDYFTVWCLLLLCHLKRKLFKSTIMPVEVLISIVKDWYEWLVSGLVHLLSNDPFRRSGLMPCIGWHGKQDLVWPLKCFQKISDSCIDFMWRSSLHILNRYKPKAYLYGDWKKKKKNSMNCTNVR